METIKVMTSSMGLASWLGIVFIILKLCGIIAWGWIWVLAPFWIGLLIDIVITIIVVIGVYVCS